MLSLPLAQDLKAAGLRWQPALHDFFMVPRPGLDDRLFVVGDLLCYVERIGGEPTVVFHGAAEWALDQIVAVEVIWLPREDQLREALEERLRDAEPPALHLLSTADGYRCAIRHGGAEHTFDAFGAQDTYALALLHLMREA